MPAINWLTAANWGQQTVATRKVFISYNHADREEVEQVEMVLKNNGISVWRDQKSIYAGEKWPKVLGEAISANDVVLLVWSKRAATSEFVELEWCIAIALKKKIIPYRLDQTPLPSSLKAIHAIDADKSGSTDQILQSLQTRFSDADTGRATAVITALDDIPEMEPKKIVGTAKAILAQHRWMVEGDVYQASGDIHIHHAPPDPPDSLVGKWQTWVAVTVGVLTAIGLLLDLPQKMEDLFNRDDTPRVVVQPLSGSIRDQSNDPLPGVKISLPKFDLQTTSNQLGYFHFEVEAAKQVQVELMAQKDGYKIHEQYATLGNTGLSFTMRKKE